MIEKFFINNEQKRIDWVKSTLLSIPQNQSLLDAWAGEMQYRKFCSHLKYTSQDFNQYDWLWDGVGAQMWGWQRNTDITSDITNIPIPESSVDNILCTEVLEHIPYPELAIMEFSRILKKWGKLILTAPFCSMTHFSPYYFANWFSEYWYKRILEENNMEILELEKNGNYFNYLEQECGRLPLMVKKYCKSNFLIIWIVGVFALIQIIILKYLARSDKWSNEMLYFGTHIVAIKK